MFNIGKSRIHNGEGIGHSVRSGPYSEMVTESCATLSHLAKKIFKDHGAWALIPLCFAVD